MILIFYYILIFTKEKLNQYLALLRGFSVRLYFFSQHSDRKLTDNIKWLSSTTNKCKKNK